MDSKCSVPNISTYIEMTRNELYYFIVEYFVFKLLNKRDIGKTKLTKAFSQPPRFWNYNKQSNTALDCQILTNQETGKI